MKDNKKGFLKYANSKRKIRDNTGPLLDDVGHLTNRDIDKAEMFNAFFASVFNTGDGPWESQSPVLEDCDFHRVEGGVVNSHLTLNLFKTY